MEAAGGFEPPNGGFADPCLTTWLRRPVTIDVQALPGEGPWRLRDRMQWSGKRGSNPRPQPWQGCALPTELFPPDTQRYERKNVSLPRGWVKRRRTREVSRVYHLPDR